jgi:hypothetical protein
MNSASLLIVALSTQMEQVIVILNKLTTEDGKKMRKLLPELAVFPYLLRMSGNLEMEGLALKFITH